MGLDMKKVTTITGNEDIKTMICRQVFSRSVPYSPTVFFVETDYSKLFWYIPALRYSQFMSDPDLLQVFGATYKTP